MVLNLRDQFPILHHPVRNQKRLAYWDSAATTQKPLCVIEAISNYYRHDNANIHRGAHFLADRATAHYEQVRQQVKEFLNAKSAQEIIFTKGATEAINLMTSSFGQRLGPGDSIVLTGMEHHANLVPWQILASKQGCQLKFIPITAQGTWDLSSIDELLDPSVKVMAFSHVSNSLGTINPIDLLIQKAKAKGIVTLIDGCQAAAHLPIDVQAIDCDFYVFSAHKVYGPTGLGVLYGKEAWLDSMPPYQGGGEMIDRVTLERSTWNKLPFKFEAGTPPIAEVYGLGAALTFLGQIGWNKIKAHEDWITQQTLPLLKDIPGLRMIGQAAERIAVFSFVLEGAHPSDVGTLLDQEGVAIRTGHHCTQPLMDFYKIPGTARASGCIATDQQDIDQLHAALKKASRMLR